MLEDFHMKDLSNIVCVDECVFSQRCDYFIKIFDSAKSKNAIVDTITMKFICEVSSCFWMRDIEPNDLGTVESEANTE